MVRRPYASDSLRDGYCCIAYDLDHHRQAYAMTKTVADEAESLLNLLESDFGQSGRDVQLEAIRCSLDFAYQRGLEHARRAAEPPHNQLGLTRGEMAEAQRKALGEPSAVNCPNCGEPKRIYTDSIIYDKACKCPL